MNTLPRRPGAAQGPPRGTLFHHLVTCRRFRPGRLCGEMLRLKREARLLKCVGIEAMRAYLDK